MPFNPDNLSESEDLTEKELKFGYWWLSHRAQLRQGLIIALLVFDAIFLGFALFKWGHYLAVGYWADQKMARELVKPAVNFAGLKEHFSAQPLVILNTYLFTGAAKTDAAAMVKNPNERFFVSFDYDFDLGGVKTPSRRGFLLPGEEKPVAELGILGTGGASGAVLELKNLTWQRIGAHQIQDMAAYLSERLNFSAAEVNFALPSVSGLRSSQLTFKLTNNSGFSYYEPKFLLRLESGGNLVGLEQAVFSQFLAGETKEVDLRLFNQNINVSGLRLAPEINIFDPQAYIR